MTHYFHFTRTHIIFIYTICTPRYFFPAAQCQTYSNLVALPARHCLPTVRHPRWSSGPVNLYQEDTPAISRPWNPSATYSRWFPYCGILTSSMCCTPRAYFSHGVYSQGLQSYSMCQKSMPNFLPYKCIKIVGDSCCSIKWKWLREKRAFICNLGYLSTLKSNKIATLGTSLHWKATKQCHHGGLRNALCIDADNKIKDIASRFCVSTSLVYKVRKKHNVTKDFTDHRPQMGRLHTPHSKANISAEIAKIEASP